MKQLIFLTLLSLILYACGGERDAETSGETALIPETAEVAAIAEEAPEKDTLAEVEDQHAATLSEEASSPLEAKDGTAGAQRGTAEYHFRRGLLMYNFNRHEEGIREFDTVISLMPTNIVAYINRGKGYLRSEEFQKARDDFQFAVDQNPNDTIALLNLALAHYYLDDLEKSVEVNSRLLELDPNNALGHFNRGIAFGRLNKYNNAVHDFLRATEINPNYHEAMFNLGLAFYWLDDLRNACISWRKALALGSPRAEEVIATYCE